MFMSGESSSQGGGSTGLPTDMIIRERVSRLLSEGKFSEAEQFYLKSLKFKETAYGEEHPAILSLLKEISEFYYKLDEEEKGAAYARRFEEIQGRTVNIEAEEQVQESQTDNATEDAATDDEETSEDPGLEDTEYVESMAADFGEQPKNLDELEDELKELKGKLFEPESEEPSDLEKEELDLDFENDNVEALEEEVEVDMESSDGIEETEEQDQLEEPTVAEEPVEADVDTGEKSYGFAGAYGGSDKYSETTVDHMPQESEEDEKIEDTESDDEFELDAELEAEELNYDDGELDEEIAEFDAEIEEEEAPIDEKPQPEPQPKMTRETQIKTQPSKTQPRKRVVVNKPTVSFKELSAIRNNLGLSEYAMATRLGLSEADYVTYENGSNSPGMILIKQAQALGDGGFPVAYRIGRLARFFDRDGDADKHIATWSSRPQDMLKHFGSLIPANKSADDRRMVDLMTSIPNAQSFLKTFTDAEQAYFWLGYYSTLLLDVDEHSTDEDMDSHTSGPYRLGQVARILDRNGEADSRIMHWAAQPKDLFAEIGSFKPTTNSGKELSLIAFLQQSRAFIESLFEDGSFKKFDSQQEVNFWLGYYSDKLVEIGDHPEMETPFDIDFDEETIHNLLQDAGLELADAAALTGLNVEDVEKISTQLDPPALFLLEQLTQLDEDDQPVAYHLGELVRIMARELDDVKTVVDWVLEPGGIVEHFGSTKPETGSNFDDFLINLLSTIPLTISELAIADSIPAKLPESLQASAWLGYYASEAALME
ncbi:hypothetical protein K8I28_04635 [bacterium]|nr:hypothetical protein [bacterium]